MSPVRAALAAQFDELLFLGTEEGEFDDAILGTTERGSTTVLVYDIPRILKRLEDMGMTDEEAWEWFATNIESAYMGDRTPLYLMPVSYYT